MTLKEIIEMARQAGLLVIDTSNGDDAVYTWPKGITEELEAFAKLVAEKEREACAKVCDDELKEWGISYSDVGDVSKAIRARGRA